LTVSAARGSRVRLCGQLWTPPEPGWPAIGEHSGCVLKRPRTAAPARRRIRMIKAWTRPWGVVGGVGAPARVDGGRGVPESCLLQSLLAAPFFRACAGVFPWSGERWGGTRVTWFGAASTNACSCVVTYDHARRACFSPFAGRCAAATRPLTRRGRMPGAWRGMRLGDLSAAASRRHDRYDPGGPPGQQAAIAALNRSAGRCQPSVLRGRSFISAATRVMSWTVCIRSVPFGK